jgi:hypothetical protein
MTGVTLIQGGMVKNTFARVLFGSRQKKAPTRLMDRTALHLAMGDSGGTPGNSILPVAHRREA